MNTKLQEIEDLLKILKEDYYKGLKGNKYAGQRARKQLSQVRYLAIDARQDVMDGIKRKRGML